MPSIGRRSLLQAALAALTSAWSFLPARFARAHDPQELAGGMMGDMGGMMGDMMEPMTTGMELFAAMTESAGR